MNVPHEIQIDRQAAYLNAAGERNKKPSGGTPKAIAKCPQLRSIEFTEQNAEDWTSPVIPPRSITGPARRCARVDSFHRTTDNSITTVETL
jgi:hypothetical protein